MNPKIVFCTTVKNRTQHLEHTLPKNLADNADHPCTFVVLDYNSEDHLAAYLESHHRPDIDDGRLVVYGMPPGPGGPIPFRMAHAKNMSHRCGLLEGADILVNLDADNYTEMDFAAYIAGEMRPSTYLWARMVKGQFRRGISGRIVVAKDDFLKAGGYDEKYDTWGPDDKDFNARLGRLGCTGKEIDQRYLNAISHNDKMRFREYKHVSNSMSEDHFDLSADDSTIANFGRFGMGTVYRNFGSAPIELGPLPTRMFGVGLHKTATTSLHAALGILGYDSAHWPSAHWARAVWAEMTTAGRSRTLERSYAACDLPISILYRQLDAAYPGSRFILTVRDEASWIDSVRRHWDANANPFRKGWDRDPFSHAIHKELYGRRDFDAETMLARFRRHNAEVKEYFASRLDDFLVLDGGNRWGDLCGFLGRPIPGVPYPKANGRSPGA